MLAAKNARISVIVALLKISVIALAIEPCLPEITRFVELLCSQRGSFLVRFAAERFFSSPFMCAIISSAESNGPRNGPFRAIAN